MKILLKKEKSQQIKLRQAPILMHSFAIYYFHPLLFLPIILTHSIAILFLLVSNQQDEYE
jgi:hypothetical protein